MKKNRIKTIVLSLILVILITTIAQAKIISDGSRLDVTVISQEPDPVQPGEVFNLRFKIENLGGGGAEDITFEFIETYPFTIYSGNAQQKIGSLQAGQRVEEGIIVHYEIKVDEDAVQGTQLVDVRYKVKNKVWVTIEDFPIRVRTRDVIVAIDSVKSDPESIEPGEEAEITLRLRNDADSLLRNIKVRLDLSQDNIPFAPIGGVTEKHFFQLQRGSSKLMKFKIIALPDAEGGIYKIPLNLSYTDETGVSISKKDIISLKISSKPDLLIHLEDSEIYGDQRQGIVSIRVVNKGLTDIKLLTVTLDETEDIELLSTNEVYVGNIDSDDYETAEFNLQLTAYKKVVDLPLKINYKDVTNKEFQQKITLQLKTGGPTAVGAVISRIFKGFFIILIIVGGGLGIRWLWKRRKNKKR